MTAVAAASFLQQRELALSLGNTSFINLAAAWHIKGYLDPVRLAAATEKLCARHEALRTSFGFERCDTVQLIHSDCASILNTRDASTLRTTNAFRYWCVEWRGLTRCVLSQGPRREAVLPAGAVPADSASTPASEPAWVPPHPVGSRRSLSSSPHSTPPRAAAVADSGECHRAGLEAISSWE